MGHSFHERLCECRTPGSVVFRTAAHSALSEPHHAEQLLKALSPTEKKPAKPRVSQISCIVRLSVKTQRAGTHGWLSGLKTLLSAQLMISGSED